MCTGQGLQRLPVQNGRALLEVLGLAELETGSQSRLKMVAGRPTWMVALLVLQGRCPRLPLPVSHCARWKCRDPG